MRNFVILLYATPCVGGGGIDSIDPYHLGLPAGSVSLFDYEEYIIMDCILRTPQIQLHEIANYITSATGSSFSPQTLCQAAHRLGMMRKKAGH